MVLGMLVGVSLGFLAESAGAAPGDFDQGFGQGGVITLDVDEYYSDVSFQGVSDLLLQPNGKIIGVGSTFVDSFPFSVPAVIRLTPNGGLDASFGSDGLAPIHAWGDSLGPDAVSFARQSDGKLVVVGSTDRYESNGDFALTRLNVDGSMDTTFGTNGVVTTNFFGQNDVATSVVIQPDGKMVAAGYAQNASNKGYDFALVRYNINGSLDRSFGQKGKVTTDFFIHDDYVYAMALQGDGRIVVAGSASDGRRRPE